MGEPEGLAQAAVGEAEARGLLAASLAAGTIYFIRSKIRLNKFDYKIIIIKTNYNKQE